MDVTTPLRALARLAQWTVATSEELVGALDTLGRPVDAATVVRAGHGAGMVAAIGGVPLVALEGWTMVPLVVAAVLGVVHAAHAGPRLLAAARRAEAGAAAATLVGRAILRARIAPSAETAVAFAADGDGVLAESLATHVRRARGNPATGFDAFADEWADRFPELARAVRSVESAVALPPGDREAALDRALDRVRSGLRDRATEAAAGLRAPTSGLFALVVVPPTGTGVGDTDGQADERSSGWSG